MTLTQFELTPRSSDASSPRLGSASLLPRTGAPASNAQAAEVPPRPAGLHLELSRMLWLHWAVSPESIQSRVPFALDLFRGQAYASVCIARVQRPLLRGVTPLRWAGVELPSMDVFGLRVCVRHRDEPGLFPLLELLPEPWLAAWSGLGTFGRLINAGRVKRATTGETERIRVSSDADSGDLSFRVNPLQANGHDAGLRQFLFHDRTLFTNERGLPRSFPAHTDQKLDELVDSVSVEIEEAGLFRAHIAAPTPVFAHAAEGPLPLKLTRPVCVAGPACARPWPIPATA